MSKKRIKWSVITTIILYLIIAFIKWDIDFILDAGNWQPIDRFLTIFFIVGKELIIYSATDGDI